MNPKRGGQLLKYKNMIFRNLAPKMPAFASRKEH